MLVHLLILKKESTIGTNFAIGETRFRLPLHLLRFTVRSSPGTAYGRARARTHDHSEAGCTRSGLLASREVRAGGLSMIRRTDTATSVEPRRFELQIGRAHV